MLSIFTKLADWIIYSVFGMSPESKLADGLHFFVEDTTKIFALLIVMIYIIAWVRASLNMDRVREYLSGKHRLFGYVAAASFGAVTPFCSCSSIPIFLGFTQARIPIGTTLAFLITSPIINEVAIVLLGSLLGVKFTICYVVVGIGAGVVGGVFIDLIKAEKYLALLATSVHGRDTATDKADFKPVKLSFHGRHEFARDELKTIFSRVWKWVLIGVGLGAMLHGFVPEEFVLKYLDAGQWWTVPAATLLGIPLYSNASGVIPVAESLLNKGLPAGTTLAFMMSTVAASFPEFMMLKQVMKPKLLIIFFLLLLVMFTTVGWILNLIHF
ncbi:MAG: permease [Planctomycetota bacterium]|nr:MAG: permease [Planctomycetota bacterium]